MNMRSAFAALAALALATSISSPGNAMTPEEIRQSFRVQAALAQFHRWYLYYEQPTVSIESQLDILAPDVAINSALGAVKGHDAYKARVTQLPRTWKNAHFVRSVRVTPEADGNIKLSAEISYLNEGMKPGTVRSSELAYTMALQPGPTVLPKFTAIDIKPVSDGTSPAFRDAYPENRARSLLHYWLALIEDPARRAEPAKEVLAPGFSLNFASGKVTDFAGFETWLKGPASSVAASAHTAKDFKVEPLGEREWRVTVGFDWEGLLPNGAELVGETKHTWIIVDDPAERFARIKTMDIVMVRPFVPR